MGDAWLGIVPTRVYLFLFFFLPRCVNSDKARLTSSCIEEFIRWNYRWRAVLYGGYLRVGVEWTFEEEKKWRGHFLFERVEEREGPDDSWSSREERLSGLGWMHYGFCTPPPSTKDSRNKPSSLPSHSASSSSFSHTDGHNNNNNNGHHSAFSPLLFPLPFISSSSICTKD